MFMIQIRLVLNYLVIYVVMRQTGKMLYSVTYKQNMVNSNVMHVRTVIQEDDKSYRRIKTELLQ